MISTGSDRGATGLPFCNSSARAHGGFAHRRLRHAYRGQRHAEIGGEQPVAESGDGDILRHAETLLGKRLGRADGHAVVVCHDRGERHLFRQRLRHRRAAGLDVAPGQEHARVGVRDARRSQRLLISAEPAGARGGTVRPGEEKDFAMAQLQQVVGRELPAMLIVAHDPRHLREFFRAGRVGVEQDGGNVGRSHQLQRGQPMLPAHGRHEQQCLDLPRNQLLHLAHLVFRAVQRGAEQHLQPDRLGLPLDSPDKVRIIGVVDLRHDDAKQSRAAQAQILRGAVGDIIAPARLGLHPRLGAGADVGGVAQSLRDGHDRQVQRCGHLLERRHAGRLLARPAGNRHARATFLSLFSPSGYFGGRNAFLSASSRRGQTSSPAPRPCASPSGNSSLNFEPWPSFDSTCTLPWWFSMIFFTIARPMPVPDSL